MSRKKTTLLSFDVEEFDAPTEYNLEISHNDQIEISRAGLINILEVLKKRNLIATFFTTASFAKENQELIKSISDSHEIASHGFDHKEVTPEGMEKSKLYLEELTGKKVSGFRSPRLQKLDTSVLSKIGYIYNSSENPIFLPGRYNNFFKKRTYYRDSFGILNIPASASPLVRFPLFWLAFKNFPLPLIKFFSKWTLLNDGYLNIYFHPWEFSDISDFAIPKVMNRISGSAMITKLENYIDYLSKYSVFITMNDFSKEKLA